MTAGSWSTGGTAVAEREEAVRDAIGGTHLPWDLRLPDPAPYTCDIGWHAIGDAMLVDCRSDPVHGRRASAELRQTDQEMTALLVVLAGTERVRQGDVAVQLHAGDALLWHSSAAIDFAVIDPLHKLTLMVPTDRIASLRPRGRVEPVLLRGDRATARLLTGHVRTMAEIGADLSDLDGLFAVDVALDLLVKALGPTGGSEEGSGTPSSRTLLGAALDAIGSGLGDPDLGPTSLARGLGISPRYLHMVFAETGETVAAYIRRRRLDRVRRDLADPSCDGETVTAIAFRWGFSGSGHLSRTFRVEHGLSPTAYREQARGRRA